MTHGRMHGAPGGLKSRRASLGYVFGVIALLAGLVATQLWPQGLIAAPRGPEESDAASQQA